MDNTTALKLKKRQSHFNKGLAALMIATFFIDNVLVYFSTIYHFKHYFDIPKGIEIWMLCISIIIPFALSISEIEFNKLYKTICITAYCLIIILSILLSKITFTIPFYFVPVLCLFLFTTSINNVVKISIATIIFIIVLNPIITKNFSEYIDELPNWNQTNEIIVQEYFDLFVSIILTLYILYFYFEFKKVSLINDAEIKIIDEEKKEELPILKNENLEKIYEDLIKYIEDYKIYQDPKCSLFLLATKTNTNKTYSSMAINQIGNTSFNSLINSYRIKQVLNDFKNEAQNKKTLKKIYLDAGFTQQSTFNRVFKEHTGLTPSDYIAELVGKKTEKDT